MTPEAVLFPPVQSVFATDWVTISALATAGGTLVLALATFASVLAACSGGAAVEMHVEMDEGLKPIYDVIAKIPGTGDQLVVDLRDSSSRHVGR